MAFDDLERRGVVVTVADALVGHGFHLDVLLHRRLPFRVQRYHRSPPAVGEEHRQVTEVVDVVVDGADAERSHARYDHGPVERAQPEQFFGQQAEIIQKIEEFDRPPAEQARNERDGLVEFIERVFLVRRVLDLHDPGVELVVNFLGGVVRVETDFQDRVRRVERERLFHHHHDLNILARVDLLPAHETVDARPLGNGAQVGGDQDVQEPEVGPSLFHLLAAVFVGLGHVEHIGVGIAGVATLRHDVGHHLVHGVDRSDLVPVGTVAEPPAAFLLRLFDRCVLFGRFRLRLFLFF